MDKVQSAQRNEYPYSTELDTIPREMLEMICHFLNAEDVAHLSGVSHSLNMSLSQRAVAIGTTGISKALSEGRADQAFSMLTSFCKWLGSAHVKFSLNEKLQVWKSLLNFLQDMRTSVKISKAGLSGRSTSQRVKRQTLYPMNCYNSCNTFVRNGFANFSPKGRFSSKPIPASRSSSLLIICKEVSLLERLEWIQPKLLPHQNQLHGWGRV